MIRGNDPILLTPGPLTTSLRTKQAMLNDWGSWDAAFNSITASIRRDMVEIEGSRMEREQISAPDYFTQELFWGSFSRKIMLPQEVDVESSSASAKALREGAVDLRAPGAQLRVEVGEVGEGPAGVEVPFDEVKPTLDVG